VSEVFGRPSEVHSDAWVGFGFESGALCIVFFISGFIHCQSERGEKKMRERNRRKEIPNQVTKPGERDSSIQSI
jgi:hypothetical protein